MVDRFLLLRGEPAHALYVRKLEPEVGLVFWTDDRARAHRFADRGQAEMVQAQVVARTGQAVAVVPA